MSMQLTLATTYDTNKWIIYRNEFKKVACVKYEKEKEKQSPHNDELLSCHFKRNLTFL